MVILSVALGAGCATAAPSALPTPAATATPSAAVSKVTGSVSYYEKIALPAGAVVDVKLLDASRQDAPAVTIGEQVITTSGNQVPLSFEIKYNPTVIDPRFTYVVRASITVEGKPWFTSDTTYPVITRGNPSAVELVLKRVPSPAPASALENTTWVLQSFIEAGKETPALAGVAVSVIFDPAKGQVTGKGGINSYFGSYKLEGGKLTVTSPLGSTLMAGDQKAMDQEGKYLKALQSCQSYEIAGSRLTLNCGSVQLVLKQS
jgi:putative lipoprotein